MAQAMGIPVPWVHTAAFAIGAGMAAASGVLFGPLVGVNHTMGVDWVLKAFIVVVVGGMGNLGGSIAAAIFISLLEAYAAIWVSPAQAVIVSFIVSDSDAALSSDWSLCSDAQMTKRINKSYWIAFSIVLALLIIAPLVLPEFWRRFLTEILIWGLLAMSSDILIGYTGMMSFGHSAFFGLGMYGAAAALLMFSPPNLWLALAFGLVASALIALFVAYFSTRLRDIYFAHYHAHLQPDLLRDRVYLDRSDGRRERTQLSPPASGNPWPVFRAVHLGNHALVRIGGGDRLVSHPAPHHPLAVRHGVAIDPRRTSRARAPSVIRSNATRLWR